MTGLGARAGWVFGALLAASGCGQLWAPDAHDSAVFGLVCHHDAVGCDACHGRGSPGPLEPECLACHEADRPATHDPATTADCAECHAVCGAGWGGASGHDDGTFPLLCNHTDVTCEDCHGPGTPTALDPACISCHLTDRPAAGHEPGTTDNCAACHGTGCTWDEAIGFHPAGFIAGDVHGLAMKLQDPTHGDCRECHGADLTGADAVGCDDCHALALIEDWRTDCVLCHGGVQDGTGAPPLDIDDEAVAISFRSHPEHAENDTHPAYGCDTCHVDASAALDPGHIFDGTAGVAEVDMSAGLSPAGTWSAGASGCGNLYCHGDGRSANGQLADGTQPLGCSDCHSMGGGLSGEHDRHDEFPCSECHQGVTDASDRIVGPDLHVDGAVRVRMPAATGLTWSNQTCSGGRCHGEEHSHDGDGW